MSPEIRSIFLLQFNQAGVYERRTLAQMRKTCRVANAIAFAKLAGDQQVEKDIDADPLQLVDKEIEAIPVGPIKMAGIVPLVINQAAPGPGRVHMVQANHIEAEGCQTSSNLWGIFFIGETGAGTQGNTPETSLCSIGEDKVLAGNLHEPVLPSGSIIEVAEVGNPRLRRQTAGQPWCFNRERNAWNSAQQEEENHDYISQAHHFTLLRRPEI